MILRFLRIKDKMMKAASLSKIKVTVPKSDTFKMLAKNYKCQLKEIQGASVYPQIKGRSIP